MIKPHQFSANRALNGVTVVIPNYNKAGFVTETIGALRNQTFTDWNAVIVDDMSTDNSTEVIRDAIDNDDRFALVCNTSRGGGSKSRNVGLEIATGEFIMFLDSDDLLTTECLENRMEKLRESDLDFVVFPMGTFYETIGDNDSIWRPTDLKTLTRFLSHNLPWGVMGPLFRTRFVREVGGFDESFPRLQDVEFHTRCLMQPKVRFAVYADANPDCYYRISTERTEISEAAAIRRQVEGISHYVNRFEIEVKNRSNTEFAALHVTLFRGLELVARSIQTGILTSDEGETYIQPLIESSLLESRSHRSALLRCYWWTFARLGRMQPKGVAWLIRRLLSF